ncbi:alpha-tocopherol transfer protein-like [Rhipicephalus sanguineus]|uniref:alpha-tocopherol transfer protein-like n=1 Tax=Rhipicephalus sanguineus TaxID=34632 RepID=UPI001893D217|nr:alpha-tocopherol transfer protein-like [Rhipicephalus sanguineus]XP_037498256.1 alpha-tocopherol transfer protein-like [Rhipicephalus sanguineus]
MTGTALHSQLRQIAEEELGETEELRQQALDDLTKLLNDEPGLNWNDEPAFLLRFLRVRKYNTEAALKSIKKYYRTRSSCGKSNLDLRPSTIVPECREIAAVLPHRDAQGRQILLIRSGVWNPAVVPQIDVHRAFLMCLKHLERSPSGQTAGIVIIIDYEGFGIEHAINCKLGLMKDLTDFAQESMPLRLRAVHVIRESRGFDFCFALLRPFLKSKIIQRIHFHGYKMEGLHEHVPASILPEAYGGLVSDTVFQKFWLQLDADEHFFAQENKYGYKNIGSCETPSELTNTIVTHL